MKTQVLNANLVSEYNLDLLETLTDGDRWFFKVNELPDSSVKEWLIEQKADFVLFEVNGPMPEELVLEQTKLRLFVTEVEFTAKVYLLARNENEAQNRIGEYDFSNWTSLLSDNPEETTDIAISKDLECDVFIAEPPMEAVFS